MVRQPAVADMFYPGDEKDLRLQIRAFIDEEKETERALGLISPHAGYVYSGGSAGAGFSAVKIPDRIVILGVDHRGSGSDMCLDGYSAWETPLGTIQVDTDFIGNIAKYSEIFTTLPGAGSDEHSIEVQVPFIQFLNPNAKIVPILVSSFDLEDMNSAAVIIADAVKSGSVETLVIASTDMSHYVSADEARLKDFRVIKKIESLDPEGMIQTVKRLQVSMCGVTTVYTMMKTVQKLGAKVSMILNYSNSGEVSGDMDQVVGYMSAAIF